MRPPLGLTYCERTKSEGVGWVGAQHSYFLAAVPSIRSRSRSRSRNRSRIRSQRRGRRRRSSSPTAWNGGQGSQSWGWGWWGWQLMLTQCMLLSACNDMEWMRGRGEGCVCVWVARVVVGWMSGWVGG